MSSAGLAMSAGLTLTAHQSGDANWEILIDLIANGLSKVPPSDITVKKSIFLQNEYISVQNFGWPFDKFLVKKQKQNKNTLKATVLVDVKRKLWWDKIKDCI